MYMTTSFARCAIHGILIAVLLGLLIPDAGAQDADDAEQGGAAASDPTAAVNFMDFGFQYFDLPKGNPAPTRSLPSSESRG